MGFELVALLFYDKVMKEQNVKRKDEPLSESKRGQFIAFLF